MQGFSFSSPDSLQFHDEDLEKSKEGCRFKVAFSLTAERDKAIRERMRYDVGKIMKSTSP